jgi:hypothetical protein
MPYTVYCEQRLPNVLGRSHRDEAHQSRAHFMIILTSSNKLPAVHHQISLSFFKAPWPSQPVPSGNLPQQLLARQLLQIKVLG